MAATATAPVRTGEVAIDVRALVKRYGRLAAVDGLDLAVQRGEVYGLLGPNGAGKTTTIRTLLGYLAPSAGTATVLGGDARDPVIRRQVGYLPGDMRLDRRLKVRDALRWFADLRGGVSHQRVAALCERLSLDQSRPFGQLSTGNRQKVGVVQALMHEPQVLVLDEPTSGLDPLIQREVLTLVRERRQAGAAVLFSSHNLPEVEEVATRVGILRTGHKVLEDSVAALAARAQQRLDLTLARPLAPEALAGTPGVVSAQVQGLRVHAVVEGSAAALLERLVPYGVDRISSDSTQLDEVFYGFYDTTEPAPDGPR